MTPHEEFMALRPAGGYRIILADPAWLFKNYSGKGEEKNATRHYKCMGIEEICALPVPVLAARDCALFIWCTWPLMKEWNRVIEAWGFEYAGLAWEWIKYNPATGKYAFGAGYGTRKNLEPCLLATRGNPKTGSRSVRDFIEEHPLDCIRAARREHSRKPDEQYDRIEKLFPAGPRIELFARNSREGWTVWGNETGKFQGDEDDPGAE